MEDCEVTSIPPVAEGAVIKHMGRGGSRVLSLIVEGPIKPHACPEQPTVSVSGAPDVCLRVSDYGILAINFYLRKILKNSVVV